MADKRISDLSSASALTLTDLLVLVNDAQTKNTTIGDLLELIASQNQFAELGVDGKIPAELLPESVFGAVTYQASWNANTNTPALPTAAEENKGWYYVVGTDGTTNVNGISDWKTGDWVVSNGSVWQKVDNTDAVSSWNGRTGAVVPVSGDYTTDQVTEATNKYYTAARVLAEVLAGLSVQNNAITNADSILTALGKAQGQIDNRATLVSGKVPLSQIPDSLIGAANYQGTWNASTNSPAIPTAATANKGWYYVVSTAGNTNIGGITDWKIGDWVISNGTAWQKVDNTDAISSFNSRTGAIIPQVGDYTTSIVAEEANLYYTGTRVRSEALTGFLATNGSSAIAATDSILTAFNKAQGQIDQRATLVSGKIPTSQLPDAILGAANYQGSWNASTNSPAIPTAATANKGWYYVVSTAGSTSIGGITDWKVGDWVISNGTAWQKVDNTDAISSWNGRTGAVVPVSGDYTTLTVTEAGSNLYYTGARVRAEVLTGLAPISGTIAATDSILTAFNKTQGQISAKENSANKGVASGYASLDTNTRLPKAQLTRGIAAIDMDFTGWAASITETAKYSFQVPGGTFSLGDQLIIEAWIGASGTNNTKTIKVYLNTTNTFGAGSGAVQVGTYQLAASGVGSYKFEREMSFLSNTTMKCGCAGTTNSLKGDSTTTMDSTAITIPTIASNFYIIVTVVQLNNSDGFKLERVALKGVYA